MTQPRSPIEYEDEVRPGYRLAPSVRWVADRPADYTGQPTRFRHGEGVHGPDQGYALLLAERIVDRLVLAVGRAPRRRRNCLCRNRVCGAWRSSVVPRCSPISRWRTDSSVISPTPRRRSSARGVSSSTGQSMTTGRFAISLRGRQKRCCANRRQRSRARRKDGARSTDSITARQRTRLPRVHAASPAAGPLPAEHR